MKFCLLVFICVSLDFIVCSLEEPRLGFWDLVICILLLSISLLSSLNYSSLNFYSGTSSVFLFLVKVILHLLLFFAVRELYRFGFDWLISDSNFLINYDILGDGFTLFELFCLLCVI